MSRGRFTTPPLAPEDDWFAEPDAPSSETREETRTPPASTSAPRARPDESRRAIRPETLRRRRIVVAAIAGAVLLLVGGVLAARAVTGSDGDGEATTTLPTTTTTPATTTTTTTTTTTSPTTTTTTTPTGTTLPEGVVLRPGDESEEVRQLQTALVELGYSTGGVDGKFGPTTEQAVQEFQSSSGLEDDGVVGPATLAALAAALNDS